MNAMDAHTALAGATVKPKKRLFCSFCAAADDESEVMIDGSFAYICGRCVDLCSEIVQTHRATKSGDIEYASWFARSEPPN
jgi:heterodisulfide reductase subunit A-like polyferredoxin